MPVNVWLLTNPELPFDLEATRISRCAYDLEINRVRREAVRIGGRFVSAIAPLRSIRLVGVQVEMELARGEVEGWRRSRISFWVDEELKVIRATSPSGSIAREPRRRQSRNHLGPLRVADRGTVNIQAELEGKALAR